MSTSSNNVCFIMKIRKKISQNHMLLMKSLIFRNSLNAR